MTSISNDSYQHRRHNKNLLMIHVIFVVKYRKQLLFGTIREDVMQYIFDICKRKHWHVRRMEIDKDHIHILMQYNPTDNVSQIVSTLKSYSTYHIWKKHSNYLKTHFWKKNSFWSDGYFACSIGNVSKEIIEKYIANQG